MTGFAPRAWVCYRQHQQPAGTSLRGAAELSFGAAGALSHAGSLPHSLHPHRGASGFPALKQEAGKDLAAGGKHLQPHGFGELRGAGVARGRDEAVTQGATTHTLISAGDASCPCHRGAVGTSPFRGVV